MTTILQSRYGPWAVVTGASSGIGREFAICLAEAGINVVITARRRALLEQLAADLTREHAVEVRVVPLDMASGDAAGALGESTRDLDVGLLVAAAGFGTSGSFLDGDAAGELEMIDVNCRAVTALTHLFAGRFVDRKRGGIVLLSSLVAFQGVPYAATYAATKAYVQSFAEGLRPELAKHGVDVLACAPGPVSSGFGERARMRMSISQTPRDVAGESLRALGKRGTVRPGWLAKGLELSLKTLPRWGRVRIMGRIMAGMTSHHS